MAMYVLRVDPLGPYPIKIVKMSDTNNNKIAVGHFRQSQPVRFRGCGQQSE